MTIEQGIYRARGIEGSDQFGFASTGTEQVAIELELLDLGNARVTSILYFSDKSTPQSVEKLKALGWEGGDTFAGISKNEVSVMVSYEDYQGKTRMNVEIQSSRFAFASPMDAQQKRAFFARINGGAAPATQAKGYPKNWDEKPAANGRPPMKL